MGNSRGGANFKIFIKDLKGILDHNRYHYLFIYEVNHQINVLNNKSPTYLNSYLSHYHPLSLNIHT